MRRPRFQFTIQRFMIWTAVLAGSLTYLLAAAQEGGASRCGTPLAWAAGNLCLLVMSYGLIRMVVWAIHHPS